MAARLAAGAARAARAVDCLTGNFTICPPALAQVAAVAAFTPESIAEADGLLHHYAANRQLLLDGLRCHRDRPPGPYRRRLLRLRRRLHLTTDSLSFCSKLLNDTGVAIAPGIDFDTVRGGSFVRLSFAGPTSDIEEALRRIGLPGWASASGSRTSRAARGRRRRCVRRPWRDRRPGTAS